MAETCDPAFWVNETHRCVMDGYLSVPGVNELQLGMLGGVMIAAPLYIKYEDPIPPAIGLVLVGGTLFAILPGRLAAVAWVIVFLGLTMGIFTAMYRSVLT